MGLALGRVGRVGQGWGNDFLLFFEGRCAETQAGTLPRRGTWEN